MSRSPLPMLSAALASLAALGTGLAVSGFPDHVSYTALASSIAVIIASVISLVLAKLPMNSKNTIRQQQFTLDKMILAYSSYTRSSGSHLELDFPVALRTAQDTHSEVESLNDTYIEQALLSSALIAKLTEMPQSTLIVGPRGSGKTTVLTRLALSLMRSAKENRSNYIPIMISCTTWEPLNQSFASWIEYNARTIYSVGRFTFGHWFRSGRILAILDNVDDVRSTSQFQVIDAINSWLDSSTGGKAIFACRSDSYLDHWMRIRHEQLAFIQPLPAAEAREYFLSALRESEFLGGGHRIMSLVGRLADALDNGADREFLLPSFIELAIEGLTRTPVNNEANPSADAGAIAVKIGDDLLRSNDLEAAFKAYVVASEATGSQWQAAAIIRLGLILEAQGNRTEAREAFQRSLSLRLEGSLTPTKHDDFTPQLSDDESAVLLALVDQCLRNEFEVSSKSLVPLGRCRQALRELRDKGFVEVEPGENKMSLFRSTSLGLTSAA